MGPPAFKAVYEAGKNSSVNNCDWDDNRKAEWRNLVRQNAIKLGGENIELNFFNDMYGGNIETIDAKNLYTKYITDVDYNIQAQSNAVASAPGAKVWMTLNRGYHSTNGKYSYAGKGMSIYIYEDGQKAYIEDKDTGTDYAHRVLLVPFRKAYQINIRAKRPIMVMPARIIGGYSCPLPSTTMQTPGYISKIAPMRIRKDWCVKVDLLKGYEDIMQWGIMFDKDGKEIDCWIPYAKTKAMEDMQLSKNLAFFLGNTIDNPDLSFVQDGGYTGFDGYLPTLKYGGGFVYNYDPTAGFSLEFDYGQILLRQDALKLTKEFTVAHGKNFLINMVRNSNQFIKDNPGACTFETFKRSPAGALEKWSISSYKAFGHSLHFKEWGALSDSRLLGNYDMANLAIMTPGTGLTDTKGNAVSAIEFYVPRGCGETGALLENDRDMRKVDGCEQIEGDLVETLMMQIHGAKFHILLNPVSSC